MNFWVGDLKFQRRQGIKFQTQSHEVSATFVDSVENFK